MSMTRRDAVKAGIGVAAAAAVGEVSAQSGDLITKVIPKSGERIPPVGIGTNRYGVGESEEERAPLRDTMSRFVEMGGQVMDTAYIYGDSEAVIGDLATELGIRDQLFLSTKTDIRGQLQGVDGLRSAFSRLQTEVIDAVLVHNLVNVQTELPVLREWKEAGRIRYIGASISTLDQFDEMEQFILNNDVDIVQFNYSLGDREAENRLLPAAEDRGLAVMINIPFAGARSSLFGVVEGHEVPAWAADFDATTWAQFFLKYIVSHPTVTVAIPGTRQVRHVNDNFSAAMGRLPTAEQRAEMERLFDSIA